MGSDTSSSTAAEMKRTAKWIPLSFVGCHWAWRDFTISTFRQGAESGYGLYQEGRLIGQYATFSAAARAAAYHQVRAEQELA